MKLRNLKNNQMRLKSGCELMALKKFLPYEPSRSGFLFRYVQVQVYKKGMKKANYSNDK